MLIDERSHFRRPGLGVGASSFAVLQGDNELGAFAVSDVEDPRFPGAGRATAGSRESVSFGSGCETAGVVIGATYAALRCVRWRSLLEVR